MNILYTVNDKFVPQLGAGISSICENNSEEQDICFYVCSVGISVQNQSKLEQLVKKYDRNITIIEIEDLKKYLDFEFDTSGWNPIVLIRLLMGEILPLEVTRVLYLDADTIVRGSLHALWSMNLADKILGMSVEPTVDRVRKEELGLRDYNYHNAGVLLVDLKKWRERQAQKIILDYYKEKQGKLFANDQDAINVALKDDIYSVLPKYNFCNIYYQYPYKFLCKLMSPLSYFSESEFRDSVENPIIIHYLGEERPWRQGNKHKYREDYKKYLGMTEWRDAPDEEGWKLYFLCWGIFNVFTKPFPKLRYSIINYLIPYFMQYRAQKLKKGKA